jgi:S1-C subfamily serine protease
MTLSQATGDLLASLSDELAAAVARVGRSVVGVHGRRRLPASGVVWQADLVVTAAHVLEPGVDITISDHAEVRRPARLIGLDASSDLALLGFQAEAEAEAGAGADAGAQDLAVAERAALDTVGPGHLVLGVARPGTPAPMASFGVITSTGGAWRTAAGGVLDAYLRADVALLPGFSGGVLADVRGRVLGLLSSHLAGGDPMAIPSSSVERIVQAIRSGGARRRAYLGISTQAVELQQSLREGLNLAQETGLMLLGLEPGAPADRAGLLLGDILLTLGGRAVEDGEALQMALGPEAVGVAIPVKIIRGGDVREVAVTPAPRPS